MQYFTFSRGHLPDVIYEVHPCKDHRSVDLISEAAVWSALLLRTNAVSNAIGYAHH